MRRFFYGVQSTRNAAETYNIFFSRIFGWVKIWKYDLNSWEILCIKISENPRKKVFYNRCWWTKLKNEYIFELYIMHITQAFFCPHGILLPPVPEIAVFWATLTYIHYVRSLHIHIHIHSSKGAFWREVIFMVIQGQRQYFRSNIQNKTKKKHVKGIFFIS